MGAVRLFRFLVVSLFLFAAAGQSGADQLTEMEVKRLLEAAYEENPYELKNIIRTQETKLWSDGFVLELTENDKCWAATMDAYPQQYDRDAHQPYWWVRGGPPRGDCPPGVCVFVTSRGLGPDCASRLTHAMLIQTDNGRLYAFSFGIVAYRARVEEITSILSRGGRAEVEYTISWQPTLVWQDLLRRDPGLLASASNEYWPIWQLRQRGPGIEPVPEWLTALLVQYDQGWRVQHPRQR